jgi:hypothetical protein
MDGKTLKALQSKHDYICNFLADWCELLCDSEINKLYSHLDDILKQIAQFKNQKKSSVEENMSNNSP